MTAAARKQLLQDALALPKKARAKLARQLFESLDMPAEEVLKFKGRKVKTIPAPQVMAELRAKYGRDSVADEPETLSQEEWDDAWRKEINKRIEEIESGKVKCIPYAQVRKELDAILGKT